MTIDALRLSPEFANIIHEGYLYDSFCGDDAEGARDSRIDARDGTFGASIAYVSRK
jgi:hypothetical protein